MTPTESERTLGEVARRLDEVFSRYESIANNLPLRFVAKDVYDQYKELVTAREEASKQQMDALKDRVEQLENDKTWLYRLIVGAVILALVALAVGTSHSFGGSSPKSERQQVVMLR